MKILPNGKSAGLDGVVYKDIKREFSSIKTDIVGIFNTSLKNRKVPSERKHDIVQRIPKKNYNPEDLTTSHALVSMNIENERKIRPIPIQAYADDIAMVAYDLKLLKEMIMKCEPLFDQAGLKVKASQCALFYEGRSGNNWYKGKGDKKPAIKVQGESIETYKRSKSYKYPGKSFTIAGEDEKQVKDFIKEFKGIIDKIKECTLPIPLKLNAFNNMALANILHHFENTKIEKNSLRNWIQRLRTLLKKCLIYIPRAVTRYFSSTDYFGGLG